MKSYYGMVHFDTQHRNLMATYIHNRDIKITEKIQSPYIYQGEDICIIKFFLISNSFNEPNPKIKFKMEQTFPFSFVIKIQVLLLKIIDYGVCSLI